MKLPAFQFYPGDWRKDPGVQSLSFHDRGVWFEILCLMHESEERGKLLLRGQPMPEDALSRLLGLDKQSLTKTLTTLVEYGVASCDPATGVLFNRRMVRDEKLRKIRQEAGKLGGNPRLLNQTANQNQTTGDNQKPTPSSSPSFSSSDNNTQTGKTPDGGFVLSAEEQGTKRARAFVPPTPDEVTVYAQEIGYPMDGQAWCDSYAAKGWMIGKAKMKDWRAAVRNWKASGWKPDGSKQSTRGGTSTYEQEKLAHGYTL